MSLRNLRVFTIMAAALLAMLIGERSMAADAQLNWTHPTQRVDGTAITLAEIKETQIDYGKCAAGNTFPATPAGTVSVAAPAATAKIAVPSYGTWCFRARSVDTLGNASDNTGPVWAIYLAPPKPPVFGVVNIVAYEVRWNQGRGTMLGRAVGTVPLGTACGDSRVTTRGTRQYHEVPIDSVALREMPDSAIIVAECEVQS